MATGAKQSAFGLTRSKLKTSFETAVSSGDDSTFQEEAKVLRTSINDADLKSTMDSIVRLVLHELLINKQTGTELLERVFQYTINAALSDLCAGNLPVLVLSDMLDGSLLHECEMIFAFVESRAEVFKKDIFFKTCKNHLLRSCNDLLRRLSRSRDTVFCGRIFLFLARIFPLSERSGLNIISEFYLDNKTIISSKEEVSLQNKQIVKEHSEGISSSKPIDYKLYSNFWGLQDFFRNPTTCYNKEQWSNFITSVADVLIAFGSFKSDDPKLPPRKLTSASTSSGSDESYEYFAKYLTSPKLLELELSDSKFRRYVLLQFLILFQYLQTPVKFKLESYVLNEEQKAWVQEVSAKVYKLLSETAPDGPLFVETIKKILKREERWNAWKNEGCPDFKTVDDKNAVKRPKRRPTMSELLRQPNNIIVGNKALNELWNICPDNWEACRSKKRNFVPSLEDFFETAIQEADPANEIDPQDKQVNDPKFAWKAVRLLAAKSPHFFSVNNSQCKQMPDYIESMILKIPKETPDKAEDLDDAETAAISEETFGNENDEMFHTSGEDNSPEKGVLRERQTN